MVKKVIGAILALAYKMRFGKKIVFEGVPKISTKAEINIEQGKLTIGRGIVAKPGTYLAVVNGGQLVIKNQAHFGRNCIIVCQDSISIGEGVAVGPNVLMYDHDHMFGGKGIQKGFRTAPIHIGDRCWIGAGSIILRGTTIGEGSVIGAGCVVKGDIPPYSLVTSGRSLNIVPLEERE